MFENFRRYPRHSIAGKAVIRRRDAGRGGQVIAEISTISQGGMGFYSPVPLETTTPVSVEIYLHVPEGMRKRDTFLGRIASICTQGKAFFMGIAFDTEIPFDHFAELIG